MWKELDETLSVFQIDPDTEAVKGFSFSGNERNRLFMNQKGDFKDVSLVSGVDFLEDGRGFAVCDFNNDGSLELGITSNQKPRFRIAQFNHPVGPYVRVKLVGGNSKSAANEKLSPRDPVGAVLIATTASSTRMFQLSSGEGFSTQNSNTVHIGLGEDSKINKLEIRWPSGKITAKKDIIAGSTVKIFETEN